MDKKLIAEVTLDVLGKGGVILNYLEDNCYIFGRYLVDIDDWKAINQLITEQKESSIIGDNNAYTTKFNNALETLSNDLLSYFYSITNYSTGSGTVKSKLIKFSRRFVVKVANIYNMDSEDFMVYMIALRKDESK
jgi:hypothetical protein